MKSTVGRSRITEARARQRRFVAFVLTFAMVAELVPAQALRAMLPAPVADALVRTEAQAEATSIDSAANLQTALQGTTDEAVTLARGASIDLASAPTPITTVNNHTLDLNGGTLTLGTAGVLTLGGDLTITNGTVTVTGDALKFSSTGQTLTLGTGVTVTTTVAIANTSNTIAIKGGKLDASTNAISGGTVTIEDGGSISAVAPALDGVTSATLTKGSITAAIAANNSTLTIDAASASDATVTATTLFSGGTVNITNGTFSANPTASQYTGVTISGSSIPYHDTTANTWLVEEGNTVKVSVSTNGASYEYGKDTPVTKPDVTVTLGVHTLVENTDYTYVIQRNGVTVENTSNMSDAGQYTVVVTGAGDYTNKINETVNAFKILPAPGGTYLVYANGADLNGQSFVYNGQDIKPDITLMTYGANPQPADVDESEYEVIYSHDVTGKESCSAVGTVTVTLDSTGNQLINIAPTSYSITPLNLGTSYDNDTADVKVTVTFPKRVAKDVNYDESQVVVYADGVKLSADDYEVEEVTTSSLGSAQLKIKAKGNNTTGEITLTGNDAVQVMIPVAEYTPTDATQATQYGTIADAIQAAVEDTGATGTKTISVIDNSPTEETEIEIPSGQDIELSIAKDKTVNATITNKGTLTISGLGSIITSGTALANEGTATIKGSASLPKLQSSAAATIQNSKASSKLAIEGGLVVGGDPANTGTTNVTIDNAGEVTVAGGRVVGQRLSDAAGSSDAVIKNAGSVSVTGGTISARTVTTDTTATAKLFADGETNGTIKISGGTFGGRLLGLTTNKVELSGGTFTLTGAAESFMPSASAYASKQAGTTNYTYTANNGPVATSGNSAQYTVGPSIDSSAITWTGVSDLDAEDGDTATYLTTDKSLKVAAKYVDTDLAETTDYSSTYTYYDTAADALAGQNDKGNAFISTLGTHYVKIEGGSTNYAGTSTIKKYTVGQAAVEVSGATTDTALNRGYASSEVADLFTAIASTSETKLTLTLHDNVDGTLTVPSTLALTFKTERGAQYTLTGDSNKPALINNGRVTYGAENWAPKLVAGLGASAALQNEGSVAFATGTKSGIVIEGGITTSKKMDLKQTALKVNGGKNSAITATGTAVVTVSGGTYTSDGVAVVDVEENATVNISDGSFTATGLSSNAGALKNLGTLSFTGGTLTATADEADDADTPSYTATGLLIDGDSTGETTFTSGIFNGKLDTTLTKGTVKLDGGTYAPAGATDVATDMPLVDKEDAYTYADGKAPKAKSTTPVTYEIAESLAGETVKMAVDKSYLLADATGGITVKITYGDTPTEITSSNYKLEYGIPEDVEDNTAKLGDNGQPETVGTYTVKAVGAASTDYAGTETEEQTFKVVNAVAKTKKKSGEYKEYPSLAAAVADYNSSDFGTNTILLEVDTVESITLNKTVRINLSGNTLTSEEGKPAITVNANSETIRLNYASGSTGTVQAAAGQPAIVIDAGTVSLANSTTSLIVAGDEENAGTLVKQNNGILYLNAGVKLEAHDATAIELAGGKIAQNPQGTGAQITNNSSTKPTINVTDANGWTIPSGKGVVITNEADGGPVFAGKVTVAADSTANTGDTATITGVVKGQSIDDGNGGTTYSITIEGGNYLPAPEDVNYAKSNGPKLVHTSSTEALVGRYVIGQTFAGDGIEFSQAGEKDAEGYVHYTLPVNNSDATKEMLAAITATQTDGEGEAQEINWSTIATSAIYAENDTDRETDLSDNSATAKYAAPGEYVVVISGKDGTTSEGATFAYTYDERTFKVRLDAPIAQVSQAVDASENAIAAINKNYVSVAAAMDAITEAGAVSAALTLLKSTEDVIIVPETLTLLVNPRGNTLTGVMGDEADDTDERDGSAIINKGTLTLGTKTYGGVFAAADGASAAITNKGTLSFTQDKSTVIKGGLTTSTDVTLNGKVSIIGVVGDEAGTNNTALTVTGGTTTIEGAIVQNESATNATIVTKGEGAVTVKSGSEATLANAADGGTVIDATEGAVTVEADTKSANNAATMTATITGDVAGGDNLVLLGGAYSVDPTTKAKALATGLAFKNNGATGNPYIIGAPFLMREEASYEIVLVDGITSMTSILTSANVTDVAGDALARGKDFSSFLYSDAELTTRVSNVSTITTDNPYYLQVKGLDTQKKSGSTSQPNDGVGATDYTFAQNAYSHKGVYTITFTKAVATVTSGRKVTPYASLPAALDAAKDILAGTPAAPGASATVQLLDNVEYKNSDNVAIDASKADGDGLSLTLDLNGHVIDGTGSSAESVIAVTGSAYDVIITDSKGTTTTRAGVVKAATLAVSSDNANVVVAGGVYTTANDEGVAYNDNVRVGIGTSGVKPYFPRKVERDECATGVSPVELPESITVGSAVAADYYTVMDGEPVVLVTYVDNDKEKTLGYYTSLNAAFTAVAGASYEKMTFQLQEDLADATKTVKSTASTSTDREITIDLNGHNLTNEGKTAATLWVDDDNGYTITVTNSQSGKGGTITSAVDGLRAVIANGALTLDGVKVVYTGATAAADDWGVVSVNNGNAELTIKDTTITNATVIQPAVRVAAGMAKVTGTSSISSPAGTGILVRASATATATATVEDGSISGATGISSAGILGVSGGEVLGTNKAIDVTAGTTTVSGGAIKGAGVGAAVAASATLQVAKPESEDAQAATFTTNGANVTSAGTVTIADGTFEAGSVQVAQVDANGAPVVDSENNPVMETKASPNIAVTDATSLTISGGTLNAAAANIDATADTTGSTVAISGGTLTSKDASNVALGKGTKLTISGGTLTAQTANVQSANGTATVTISGSDTNLTSAASNVVVGKGDTFNLNGGKFYAGTGIPPIAAATDATGGTVTLAAGGAYSAKMKAADFTNITYGYATSLQDRGELFETTVKDTRDVETKQENMWVVSQDLTKLPTVDELTFQYAGVGGVTVKPQWLYNGQPAEVNSAYYYPQNDDEHPFVITKIKDADGNVLDKPVPLDGANPVEPGTYQYVVTGADKFSYSSCKFDVVVTKAKVNVTSTTAGVNGAGAGTSWPVNELDDIELTNGDGIKLTNGDDATYFTVSYRGNAAPVTHATAQAVVTLTDENLELDYDAGARGFIPGYDDEGNDAAILYFKIGGGNIGNQNIAVNNGYTGSAFDTNNVVVTMTGLDGEAITLRGIMKDAYDELVAAGDASAQDYDFTLEYLDATETDSIEVKDVGTQAVAKVTGINNYGGVGSEGKQAFTVVAGQLDTIKPIADQTYTGSDLRPEITVLDAYGNKVDPSEYTVGYNDNTNAGKAIVLIATNDPTHYTGNLKGGFAILPASIATAEVSGIEESYDYTGADIEPTPVVTFNGTELAAGEDGDYTVSYAENLNAGTATVTIAAVEGEGKNFTGSLETTFAIAPVSIELADVAAIAGETYDGTKHEPTPVVTYADGAVTLVAGDEGDYTITGYGENLDAGTGTITIAAVEGEGKNFTGTREIEFAIAKADIAQADVSAIEGVTYSGSAYTPVPTVTFNDGLVTLEKDVDFDVEYDKNVNVGTAGVTLKGIGTNFTGVKLVTFTIAQAPLNAAVKLSDVTAAYDGSAKAVEVKAGMGAQEGADYKVTYYDESGAPLDEAPTAAGTYTAKATLVEGSENFTQPVVEIKATLVITAGAVADASIASIVKSVDYTGAPIVLSTTGDEPQLVVTDAADASKVLAEGVDYRVSYKPNTGAAGTVTVTVEGINNYAGTATGSFVISPAQIAAATTSAKRVYTGEPVAALTNDELTVSATYAGAEHSDLVLGTDYEVVYPEDLTTVGTKPVTVRGIGNFAGELPASFAVVAYDIDTDGVIVAGVSDKTGYTGQEITFDLTITRADNDAKLGEGDYKATYASNVEVGTATITIEGQGGYTGTITKTFEITENSRSALAALVAKATDDIAEVKASPDGIAKTADIKEGDSYAAEANIAAVNAAIAAAKDLLESADASDDDLANAGLAISDALAKLVSKPAEANVAKIDDLYYETLQDAFDAAVASQPKEVVVTIVDEDGDGQVQDGGAGLFASKAGRPAATDANIVLDLAGLTYVITKDLVGSPGYESQSLHLEKGNTVTIKNGTIATDESARVGMLVQNYCDLTLEGVTLDGSKLATDVPYTLSNNNGSAVIGSGTTIVAAKGGFAFDVCATSRYPEGVAVTVEDGATIEGAVEYGVWGSVPANNQATLTILGGTFSDMITVDPRLASAVASNVNIAGGEFPEAVPAEQCAEGFAPTGSRTREDGSTYFTVLPAVALVEVDGAAVSEHAVAEGAIVYDGEAISGVAVQDATTGYEVAYERLEDDEWTSVDAADVKDAGSYRVTVTGDDETLAGSDYATFEIAAKSLAGVEVSGLEKSYAYTGEAIAPAIVVTDGTTELVKDVDYELSYGKNVDVTAKDAPATVTIAGKGNYAGRLEATFAITRALVERPEAVSGLTYDGSEQTGVTYEADAKKAGYALAEGTVVAAKSAGSYQATFALDANHAWASDGSTDDYAVSWSIARASIDDAVIGTVAEQTYTGSGIEPTDFEVKLGSDTLKRGTDYALSYDNNTNVTTEGSPAKITVTGTGNYTGSASATFAITPATATLPADLTVTYDGEIHTIEGNATVVMTTIAAAAAGSHYGKATPAANYRFADDVKAEDGAATVTLTITPASLKDVTVSVAEGSAYTGQEQKPAVTAKLGKLTLAEGTDFTVTYENNVNAGTAAKATVKAVEGSNFAGEQTVEFEIARAVATAPTAAEGLVYDGTEQEGVAGGPGYVVEGGKATEAGPHKATASLESDNYVWDDDTTADKTYNYSIAAAGLPELSVGEQPYTGSQVKPAVSLTDAAGEPLEEGVDYDVAYGENVAPGKEAGSVTVTGKGNYAGETTVKFDIVAKSATKPADVTATYDGKEHAIAAGEGYALSDNYAQTDAGTYTVTATLESGYLWGGTDSGDATATLTITAADLSAATVSGVSSSYAFTGSAIKPTPTVTLAGKTLAAGTDYDVSYGANTAQGSTGTVTVTGKGNYSGSVGKTFAISTVSKAALNSAISSANSDLAGTKSSSKSGTDLPANEQWTTPAARNAAQAAITAARAVASNANATQAQVDAAAKAVSDAKAAFDNAKAAGAYRPTFSTLSAHIQTYGWQNAGWNGYYYQGIAAMGTTGQSKRVEAMRIGIAANSVVSGSLTMSSHVQGTGDQRPTTVSVGQVGEIGTTGQSKRMEAVWLSLSGDIAKGYSVWYRAHIQTKGWLGWAKDGDRAGSASISRRMEALQVVILPKGETPTGYNASTAAYVTSL